MITLKSTIVALGFLVGMSQANASMEVEARTRVLMRISDYREIRKAALELRQLSEVRQIMLVDALRDYLADNSKVRLDGYVFQDGEQDLRVVAGRAEWFIDQVVLMPREAENSVRKMNERIDMWKATTASRRTLTPEQVETLKTKYAGKIHIGIVGGKANESIQNFENFLDEWFPYGKSLQELEGILGIKLPVERGEVVARIDTGYGGMEYRFLHDAGTIRAVKTVGLE